MSFSIVARGGARVGIALIAIGVTACQDRAKTDLAPAASSLAPSTTPPTSSSLTFTIDPKSTSSIDMPAPKEHIKAVTDAAQGTLTVDLANLASSRGEVKVDLGSLATKTFDDAAKDKTQTAHARTWLEVSDGEEGKLPDDVKKANQFAVYAIRTIDRLSASDVTKVPAMKDGADEVRSVTMTTHGELLVHGHKVDRDAEVEARFVYAPGAPANKPKAVLITTKKPLRVVLGEHDVKPRDGFGKIAKGAFNLLGTKVADTADISLDLRAIPQS